MEHGGESIGPMGFREMACSAPEWSVAWPSNELMAPPSQMRRHVRRRRETRLCFLEGSEQQPGVGTLLQRLASRSVGANRAIAIAAQDAPQRLRAPGTRTRTHVAGRGCRSKEKAKKQRAWVLGIRNVARTPRQDGLLGLRDVVFPGSGAARVQHSAEAQDALSLSAVPGFAVIPTSLAL